MWESGIKKNAHEYEPPSIKMSWYSISLSRSFIDLLNVRLLVRVSELHKRYIKK